ncbi:ABC transporter permease [Paragemmobacter ruber]|uniref:Transport permease protein n=1 Tax=Paragemmobacter ruber TaxID=1985673 RepID=A0ABW9Y3H3_9RHOB|nr:ABC transporter permease [Rhodobacter ruber]NBE06425.1 ABC transporter permease [Rhodobacter ruber]
MTAGSPLSSVETARSPSFRTCLRIQIRTIFALILRETRVRYGRSRMGYAWAFIEPILIVAFISLAISGIIGRRALSYEFGIFYALGVVNFQFFRHACIFIGQSIEANAPLFNYPAVHEVDAALARIILEAATYLVINLAIFLFIVLVFGATWPAHPEAMIIAFLGLAMLAFGVGLNLAALQRRFEMTLQIYGLVTAPLLLLSAVIFSLENVSPEYRAILIWNPVVHGVEGARMGYYTSYGETYVSFGYLYFVGLTAVALGLFQVLLTRRGMR